MNKKTAYRSLITISLLFLILKLLNIYFVEFVYVSPRTNTAVLPYISKTIAKINKGLDVSMQNRNRNGFKMKFLYKNAYGSGFLINNPIPNDLDYAVGIHLGKYKYDGKNSEEIAKDIENKMSTFQCEFYNYIYSLQDKSLLSNFDLMSSIIFLDNQKNKKIESMSYGIDKIFKNKDYIYYTVKQFEDYKDAKINYPFLLKSNEILVEDYNPISLYTSDLKYNKNQEKKLREITIVLDFFVDIENVQTKQIKHVEIVSESFVGQKFQLSRRFFVPIVFVNETSAKYLKNLDYLNNDEEYIEHRMLNFRRHLQEFSNLKELNDRPVKMLKRILQCTDLISPALNPKLKEEIYKTVSKNLENKDIQLMNDYTTALGNLIQITTMPKLYYQAVEKGEIQNLIDSMQNNLNSLQKSKTVNKKDLEALETFQKQISQENKNILKSGDLLHFNEFLMNKMNTYNKNIINIFSQTIQNNKELLSYISIFDSIYAKAGFHKINLYWLDNNTIGILKDDFTKKIPQSELKKMAIENDLVDVNYKFINQKQAPSIAVRYSVWVRYNSTEQEEKNWKNLKEQLLADKNNFKIKRKFIPKF